MSQSCDDVEVELDDDREWDDTAGPWPEGLRRDALVGEKTGALALSALGEASSSGIVVWMGEFTICIDVMRKQDSSRLDS